MKNVLLVMLSYLVLSGSLLSQQLTDLDFVSPFHDGVAAVKKGDQWGFIDSQGTLTVDFRDDLVIAEDKEYPIFSNKRCLIKKMKEEIAHFGFIDTRGNEVIPPEFLNATQFKDDRAVVIKIYKESLGRNEILDKNVILHRFNEEIIDPNGKAIAVLRGPFNLLYTKEKLRKPPKIQSRLLNEDFAVVLQENGQWEVKAIQLNQ